MSVSGEVIPVNSEPSPKNLFAIIPPEDVILLKVTSLPVIAKLLESINVCMPVSWEPSPKYNPKEAVALPLTLLAVILPNTLSPPSIIIPSRPLGPGVLTCTTRVDP